MPPAAGPDPLQCAECGKHFSTVRGLDCHVTHAHGRKRPATAFVVSSICPGWGDDYRTRFWALEHVERGSAACRAAVLEGGLVPHPPALVAAADVADRAWRHQARLKGSVSWRVRRPLFAGLRPSAGHESEIGIWPRTSGKVTGGPRGVAPPSARPPGGEGQPLPFHFTWGCERRRPFARTPCADPGAYPPRRYLKSTVSRATIWRVHKWPDRFHLPGSKAVRTAPHHVGWVSGRKQSV